MAQLIGGLATSHIPAIGGAIHKGLQNEPYWAPFFAGYPPVQRWLASARPDVLVIFYNDHGLNFFLDKMPTFAIGAAVVLLPFRLNSNPVPMPVMLPPVVDVQQQAQQIPMTGNSTSPNFQPLETALKRRATEIKMCANVKRD